MSTEDAVKAMRVTQADMAAKGLVTMHDGGITITEKGKAEAQRRWMDLDAESRILFGWLTKQVRGA